MTDLLTRVEDAIKKPVWDCRTCGQCVLHSTGMTCPMTCPKTLRNGPCGGVRENGHCEVVPEMRCVWVKAEERSRTLPLLPKHWREEINHLRPPVNNQLENTSSWLNLISRRDRKTPLGWQGETSHIEATDPELSLVEIEGPFRTPFHTKDA